MSRNPTSNDSNISHIGEESSGKDSLLQKTLIDLLNITDEAKETLWNSFEAEKMSSLSFSEREWRRLEYFGLYPDDSLDSILALSLEYIHSLWHSKDAFKNAVESVIALAEVAVGLPMRWDIEHSCNSISILDQAKAGPLGSLYITPSFFPEHHLQFLHTLGISKWNDLRLSERDIVERFGLTSEAIKSILGLQMLYPYIERAANYMAPIIGNEEAWASFESLMRHLISRRTKVSRNTEILMQRMAWACERPKTLESLGQKAGLSRERVRQIEGRLVRKMEHTAFVADLLPLWFVVLSCMEAHGILSLSELSKLLQSHFGWPTTPPVIGLSNLISVAWKEPFEKKDIRLDQDFLWLNNCPCISCVNVLRHIVGLVSDSMEIEVEEIMSDIRDFCSANCKATSRPRMLLDSFFDFLARQSGASDAVMVVDGKVVSKGAWDLRYGSMPVAIDAILKRRGQAMHFSEIHGELLKIRGDSRVLSLHTVHAALGKSGNALLWGRGMYIHRQNAPFPFWIIRNVEEWLREKLEDVPFVTVFGAFRAVELQCIDAGVPSEAALYSCLRVSADPMFEYPKYPYIYLASTYGGRLSLTSVMEDFVKGFDGVVSLEVLKEYAVKSLDMKEITLSQVLERTPNILRTRDGYLHLDIIDIDKEKLIEIIDYAK